MSSPPAMTSARRVDAPASEGNSHAGRIFRELRQAVCPGDGPLQLSEIVVAAADYVAQLSGRHLRMGDGHNALASRPHRLQCPLEIAVSAQQDARVVEVDGVEH